jgi:FKBP-type peptidyl-prolyl cis-trans isomerase 2
MAKKRLKAKKRVQTSRKNKTPNGAKKVKSAFSKKKILLFVGLVVILALMVIIGGGKNVVKEDSTVTIHYTGTLDDGTVFDTSINSDPLSFKVGEGKVIKGMELGVVGMKEGDKKILKIPYQDAYGGYDEEATGEYPRKNVPADMEVKVGSTVFLQSAETKSYVIATVLEIKDEVLVLDLNHPLAGRNLNFDVEIMQVG